MAAKKHSGDVSSSNPRARLVVAQHQAETLVTRQSEKGLGLLSLLDALTGGGDADSSWNHLQAAERRYKQWDEYNLEMLRSLFDSAEVATQYSAWGTGIRHMVGTPLDRRVETVCTAVSDKVAALDSIKQRLHLYEEVSRPKVSDGNRASGGNVFVVHGHDEAAKQSVARFIEKLGLRAIILHEQPSKGRTIIEKFEDYSDVGYAVVLLTADDICAPQGKPEETQPRPRQNVVFELGFFVGKLGRDRVCVLYEEGVEIPSDYQGVIFEKLDAAGAWRLKVGKEMKEAGMDVDLNKL